jgi:predicted MPP superfamily phosphohydrolase
MKSLSSGWHKRMAYHLMKHRQQINESTKWFSKIRLREFSGHRIHETQLTNPIKIAHLTDQHVGRVTPYKVQLEAINLALAQKPDLMVLTGDFVCHSELYLDDLTEIISKISCPKFANAVRKALLKANVEILDNAHTTIKINSDILQIVGVDDAYTKHDDVLKATKGLNKSLATIGLSHIPEVADKLWENGVPLVLSGHTHAGQITVAKIQELVLKKIIGHKYIHGFYGSQIENPPLGGAVYVSAGIGAAVMPLRLGEKGKREVAIFNVGEKQDKL